MRKHKFLFGIVVLIGVASVSLGQDNQDQKATRKEKGELVSSRERNLELMRKLFLAVEQHDEQAVVDLCQPDVEFHWPPSLPYGESERTRSSGSTWSETWAPLQPTESERRMDPRIVAASDDEVVVLWQQRGVSAAGEHFDGEVLGLYRFRDNRLARAQMFYFDTTAVNNFLAKAITPEMRQKSKGLFDRVNRLAQERQVAVRRAYWKLQTLSPERWHQELNSDRFTRAFSDEERSVLGELLNLSAKQSTKERR